MSIDVRVRRCRVTVRRDHGWAWGDEPRRHVDAALAQLETLLTSVAAEVGVPPSAAIRLEAPLTLELGSDGEATAASRAALALRLRAALDMQPAPMTSPAARAAAQTDAVRTGDGRSATVGVEAGPALARVLAAWSRGGRVAVLVAAWPTSVVRAWVDAAWAAAAPRGAPAGDEAPRPGRDPGIAPGGPGAMAPAAIAAIAAAVLGGADAAEFPDAAERREVRLLILLAALAAALGGRLPDRATQAEARRAVALPPDPTVAGSGAHATAAPPADAATRADATSLSPGAITRTAARPGAAAPAARNAAMGTVPRVVPALPFLVLAQLERIGYVDAMVAAAAGAGLPSAGGLAAALAGKALAPVGPEGRRTPAETAAVALAAGLDVEDVGPVLDGLPGDELAAPLASALLAAYADGRASCDELLVTGRMCGEASGLLPAAWVTSDEALTIALATLGDPPVRHGDDFAPLIAALERRRALPLRETPALERQLGAAVGTALGLLAADLWGKAEQATPLLALERLGDLEAQVSPGAPLVVGLPRGQRWLDLQRAGLLAETALPWLPGGRMDVGTW